MFILEKYEHLDVVDVGSEFYYDVVFKKDFLDKFKQLLDECKEKIIVFDSEMNSDEIIDFIKKAQSKHFSATSGCDLFWKTNGNIDESCFEIYVYKEQIESDDYEMTLAKAAVFKVKINLLDKTKPYMYISK